ncbi:MAG: FtsW/RodA/SpoVE family cell cycle protein [Eubacteriales bacterium]|nr:FtsW/RodA/SpoVE family cell cycle protein [Eubacteriales bacterium]
MRTQKKVEKMRKALMRSNTRLLLTAVVIFQALAMLLIALKPETASLQPLILAAAIPLVTILVTNLMGKIWPVDRAILILVLLLASVGLIALSDICRSEETPRTQAIYALVGVVAMFIGAGLIRGLSDWKKRAPLLMVLCALALVTPWLPAPIGGWYDGARNWIHLGPVSGQPSEFMKPVLIVILAAGFSNRARFARCLPYIAFAALCCGILLTERDLGALLLYFLTTVLMYYVASSNGALCIAGLGMGAGAAVIAYNAMPYVQDRVAIWKNPWSDPLDAGYQIVHALIAIGSGGLFGMGLGLGMPRNVPLYHSDFIFTSIAEEFGLIFSIALMAVYVLIIMRGLIVAMNARTSFHSITAFGLVAMLGLQALLIIGGNTKLLPLTGVTLPLVSYGGSSLVSTFFSMGMLLGISSMNAEDEARDIEKIALREEVRP